MEPTLFEYALCILAGGVAGFVNTLAGSGSLLTLPALMFLGLPAHVANGTNRIGILLAALVAARTFKKEKKLPVEGLGFPIGASLVGAVAGAMIAVELDPQWLNRILGVLMLLLLATVCLDSKRWLRTQAEQVTPSSRISTLVVFFAIGVYGGFIQAGVGLFLLAGLVLNQGMDLARANAVKVLIVLFFTIPALLIFVNADQVHWRLGLLLAGGQVVGAYAAARFASRSKNAEVWIRRLLVVVLLVSAVWLLFFKD